MTLLEIILAPFVFVGALIWGLVYFAAVLIFMVIEVLVATAIVWVPLAILAFVLIHLF